KSRCSTPLDTAVARVLRLVERATAHPQPAPALDVDAHHALARTAAAEGAVLLKNDDGILPLRLSAGDMIAVVGEFARTPRFQLPGQPDAGRCTPRRAAHAGEGHRGSH